MLKLPYTDVKRTNNIEINRNWKLGFWPSFKGELFIRCNHKGEVNWDKAPVYNIKELFKIGNVIEINRLFK